MDIWILLLFTVFWILDGTDDGDCIRSLFLGNELVSLLFTILACMQTSETGYRQGKNAFYISPTLRRR